MDDGGWAYGYNKKGAHDLSVTGWQIQALKAAHYSGIDAPGVDKALDRAIEWVKTMQDKKTGSFGYNAAGGGVDPKGHRLTGVGVLALQIWRSGHAGQIINGLRFITNCGVADYGSPDANLYAWYYETQACINAGGSHWDKWKDVYQDQLAANQSPDGSWPAPGKVGVAAAVEGALGGDGGVYRTALCTLMLEVFYRYLPSAAPGAPASSATPSFLDMLHH